MAVKVTPITKFTIDSKNFRVEDPDQSDAFLPEMNANVLSQADAYLGKFAKAIQSATNDFEWFNSNLKKVDQLTDTDKDTYAGRFKQSFYTNTADADNVDNVLQATNARVSIADPSVGYEGFDIAREDAVMLSMRKNFKNRQARSKAVEELDKVGGTLTEAPTKKNKYSSIINVPMSKAQYDSIMNDPEMTDKQKSSALTKYIKDAIPKAEKENRLETSRQNDARKEKEAKEKERKEKQDEKEQEASNRRRLSVIMKILAALAVISNLMRKLLAKTFSTAIESKQNATEGHAIGLTTEEVRHYKYFDMAHGMQPGTSVNAMQALQNAFGDEKTIESAKFDKVAVVLNEASASLIGSGKLKKEPDKMMQVILDGYFNRFKAGIDSSNNRVGQNEARRDLVNQLGQSFPELAAMLNRMIEDYQSGIYKGKFKDTAGWLATTKTVTPSDTTANAFQEMGSLLTSVNAKLKSLTETYLAGFALSLVGLVQKVDNIQFGMTATEKNETNTTNKQLSREKRDAMQTLKEQTRTKFEETFQKKFGDTLANTGLTMEDIISYKKLDTKDISPRAGKIREVAGKIVYGDNPDLLGLLGSYEEYSRLYKQADKNVKTPSGKVEYNSLDYTLSMMQERIAENIKEFVKPEETGTYKYQGQTVGQYKNLVSRLRDDGGAAQTKEERRALRHGLNNYLNTYGDVETQIKESKNTRNDFLDEIAVMYNAQNPKDKIGFGWGINIYNMSAEGRQKFEEVFSAGKITDEMILQAYINLLSGKGNAVIDKGTFMKTMADAFYETQYDYNAEKASDISLAEYVLHDLSKAVVESYRADYKKRGITLDNEAVVSANADTRTLNITLYGYNKENQRVKLDTISYGAYDSSIDKAVDVNLGNIIGDD